MDVNTSKITERQYCKNGDLIIADASEDYADIGKAIEIVHVGNEKIVAGLHTIHARLIENQNAIGFGGYMLRSERVRAQIMTIAQGTKVLGLSSSKLASVMIPFPSKEIQTKIANFLSAINKKIDHTKTQIDKAEQWKNGLLQQMFV
ncbi:restriction endonuclease subunit S [Dyadobacter sp. LHD-138]|uniref:restriction endonuclease subunit S n=1 Tax=Dyadobacter sp. LHD-138 TaxID=3071413 RepID=UPI0027E0DC33|nr:restriction endonuclease subunit S [Dyadobacter sp. LHD-138]MDQ6478862.1 restriction endonuclease subunit S [Dyadobacter sp. LHD-138]